MKKVEMDFIDMLVSKYIGKYIFTQDELIDCYAIDKSGKYIACYNSGGDCFIEEYPSYDEMMEDQI